MFCTSQYLLECVHQNLLKRRRNILKITWWPLFNIWTNGISITGFRIDQNKIVPFQLFFTETLSVTYLFISCSRIGVFWWNQCIQEESNVVAFAFHFSDHDSCCRWSSSEIYRKNKTMNMIKYNVKGIVRKNAIQFNSITSNSIALYWFLPFCVAFS